MSSPKSTHGAKSSHQTEVAVPEPTETPVAAQADTTSQNETSEQSSEPALSAEPAQSILKPASPMQGLLFPVAVTVLAVLPVAIGIGFARAKAAALVAEASQVVEQSADEPAPVEVNVVKRPTDRGFGDRQFLERNYEVALRYYESLGSTDTTRLPPELLYRIGLCQEGLGLWNEALENLNHVSEATDNPQLKVAADFGQVRIWLRQDERDRALAKLISLQFHSGTDTKLPAIMSQEIRFLIPLTSAFELSSKENKADGTDTVRMGELFVWSSETAFAWANPQKRAVELDESIADAVVPTNTFDCQVSRKSGIASDSKPLEQFMISARSRGQSIREIFEHVAKDCLWRIEWTTAATDVSLERLTEFSVEELPVSHLLTSLCIESNLTWTLQEDRLIIGPADANLVASRQMIALTLESLIASNPIHRFVEHSRFALARIAEANSDYAGAAKMYSSITGRNSSPLAIRAAYSAGLNFLKSGDTNRACSQFGYVVKGAPGHEYHIQSLLRYGQLLLERGEFQAAIFQFRRATEAEKYPECQAIAAAYLGMTFIMQEKYQEAAGAVLAQRSQFDNQSTRNAGALVTSLARWNATAGDMQEREAAFMYRTLVAVAKESDWFGHTGQLLIGRLYAELGFHDQMCEHFTAQLSKGVPEHIADEMKFTLANYDYSHDRCDAAKKVWKDLSGNPLGVWANRSKMRLAEISLKDGDARGCIDICRSIRTKDGVARKDLLKLMGRAFEELGDDLLAARCFAGQLPKE